MISSSYVPARACTVSFTGPDGIRHSLNVQAETLYEAVVLAIRAFREHDCAPGAGSQLEVEAPAKRDAHGEHSQGAKRVAVVSPEPSDKIMKERFKGLLAL